MSTDAAIEKKLGALLRIGTLLSSFIVLIGGLLYLAQHGSEPVPFELLQQAPITSSIQKVWQEALSFTPLGIVQLGLLILVGAQILRVAFLFIYYASIRDYWFTLFCGFVLLILIYSFV